MNFTSASRAPFFVLNFWQEVKDGVYTDSQTCLLPFPHTRDDGIHAKQYLLSRARTQIVLVLTHSMVLTHSTVLTQYGTHAQVLLSATRTSTSLLSVSSAFVTCASHFCVSTLTLVVTHVLPGNETLDPSPVSLQHCAVTPNFIVHEHCASKFASFSLVPLKVVNSHSLVMQPQKCAHFSLNTACSTSKSRHLFCFSLVDKNAVRTPSRKKKRESRPTYALQNPQHVETEHHFRDAELFFRQQAFTFRCGISFDNKMKTAQKAAVRTG